MKRQELIVLLMIAEGRGDDLFLVFKRDLLTGWLWDLCNKGMLEEPMVKRVGALPSKLSDKARIFLEALDTVPLPQPTFSMNQVCGD